MVTQHYDTLKAIGADANSNLILLPNSPQAGSDMLNNMIASFSASSQVGQMMKKTERVKPKEIVKPQPPEETQETNSEEV